jgi:hypothetical protein
LFEIKDKDYINLFVISCGPQTNIKSLDIKSKKLGYNITHSCIDNLNINSSIGTGFIQGVYGNNINIMHYLVGGFKCANVNYIDALFKLNDTRYHESMNISDSTFDKLNVECYDMHIGIQRNYFKDCNISTHFGNISILLHHLDDVMKGYNISCSGNTSCDLLKKEDKYILGDESSTISATTNNKIEIVLDK